MKYVRKEDLDRARKVAPGLEECPNIDKGGSVRGMVQLYGWKPNEQVRIGGYIYNIGPWRMAALVNANLVRG